MINFVSIAKWIGLFCLSICLFCPGLSFGQSSSIDSLQHALSIAKDDTNKAWLLLSLSESYRPIDRQKAMECADSARVLSGRLNYVRGLAFSRRMIGILFREKRDYEQAIAHYGEAEKLFRSSHNPFELARTHVEHARALIPLGRKQAAFDTLHAAKGLYLSLFTSPDSGIAKRARRRILETFHYAWYAHYVTDNFQQGLDVLKEFEHTALGNNSQDALPNLYNNFGATYRAMGEYEKALEYYFKGLTIARELNAWEDQQRLHNNIAVLYSARSEYSSTREHLVQALNILTTHQKHDIRSLAHAYGNLAGTETKLGRYADALEHYLIALKLFEEHSGPLELGNFLVEFSEYYSLQSDHTNTTHHLNRALGLYRQINNTTGISHVLFQLGKVATAQHLYEKAIEYHTQSLDIRRTGTEKLYIALSMHETGNVLLLMARKSKIPEERNLMLDSAASLFRHGAGISRAISDENTLAKCLNGLGQAEMARGEWKSAKEFLESSALIADTLGLKRELYETYALLSEASVRLQRYDDAYRYHQLYAAIKDSVFNETASRQLKESQARYDSEKKDIEITSLNQQNEIAALRVKQQESALKQAELQSARRESDITLLNRTQELQQQQLENVNRTLTAQELEAKARSAELETARKDQMLQEQALQQQRLVMYGSIAFAVLTIVLGFVLFNRFQLRKELDKRNAILEERRRISSDMHDDLGSSLSTIALLSQVMKQHGPRTQDRAEVEKISMAAQQSLEKMSEIVWSLNPRNDKLKNLVAYIRKYAVEYFENSPVKCTVTMSGNIPDMEITGEQRRNIFLTVKESLHNIIKHSGAMQVTLAFEFVDHTILLSVHDNGKGIDVSKKNAFGNGIANMQRRMKEAGGEIAIENKNGTTVKLRLPVA